MNIESKYKYTLMLIDDDEDLCDIVKGFFGPRGFAIKRFIDAEHALADLERATPDIILTDLMLPNMTGIEFTERVKQLGLATPIILITAHKSVEIAVKAIEAGAYDFIVKPLHFPQLFVSVERALHLNRVNRENMALRAAVLAKNGSELNGIIGKSPGFLKALDLAKRVSNSAANVFVTGESGTGKEVIARCIHTFGNRKDKPFIPINCSAIPENLLESELFGYAKGAFTGASDKKIGLFEEAQGGTLFLDEIGDLSLPLQAKILRVLQERKIRRIGENQDREIDVRVVSATHKNLRDEINHKRFREDLFFRLNVIPIMLPPLRERKEDIIPLTDFFLAKYAALNGSQVRGFCKEAIEHMLNYSWPGNVRELENTIERAVVLCQGSLIDDIDLIDDDGPSGERKNLRHANGALPLAEDGRLLTLEELTDLYIRFAIEKNEGAKDRTARELGIDRKTLYRRLQQPLRAAFENVDSGMQIHS
jgi:DNA-binding NtrC family response regulator